MAEWLEKFPQDMDAPISKACHRISVAVYEYRVLVKYVLYGQVHISQWRWCSVSKMANLTEKTDHKKQGFNLGHHCDFNHKINRDHACFYKDCHSYL